MPIDAMTVILTAICTGIGVSLGNTIFEIYLKKRIKKLQKHQTKEFQRLKNIPLLSKKKPWLAALLNFFIWGLGYLYLRKRVYLGVLLILVELFITGTFSFAVVDLKTVFEGFTYTFMVIIISCYLGYDAYQMAKENGRTH